MKTAKLFDNCGLLINSSDLEELCSQEVKKSLDEHGAVLIRGSLASPEVFRNFTYQFTDNFLTHGASVRQSVGDKATQTVTKGSSDIVLHFEMHYSPLSPDIMWFYCAKPPRSGGATTICDGAEFYQALSPKAQSLLASKKLKYKNRWSLATIATYFPDKDQEQILNCLQAMGAKGRFLQDGELEFDYTAPAIQQSPQGQVIFGNCIAIHRQYEQNLKLFQHKDQTVRHAICFEDDSPIPESLFEEIFTISAQLEKPCQWQQSDILMLDNRRVMHGRKSYPADDPREILVRMAYWHKKGSDQTKDREVA